jgi:E3 ubiquitin-protein ligase TRIP12
MDLSSIHHQEATSSSSASNTHHQQHISPATSLEPKPIRSSARVKAAKQKLQLSYKSKDSEPANTEPEPGTSAGASESVSTRSTRISPAKTSRLREGNTGKGKDKEVISDASTRSHKRLVHSRYQIRP